MKCRAPGCGSLIRGKYCEKHLHDNPRSNKETEDCYKGAWPRFAAWLRSRNPICQKLTNGVQCMTRAQLVHHLISPRVNLELLLDPANCVCLCRAHHPTDEGTPNWKPSIDFTPTEHSISL